MTRKLTFLGATGTVTGSKTLLTAGATRVLVDCGLFQGLKQLRLKNRDALPVTPDSIDAVVLTHAHIDHSGYLPLLVKNGFRGRIYCTSATRDLCQILLPDAGYLQEEEARYANKHGFSKQRNAIPDVPVFLNSPMAVNATCIFHNHAAEHRLSADECTAACAVATMVNSADESRALNARKGPMIIISASGMATGGRVLHHLKAFASDARNMVLFPGFLAAGTRGAAMLGGADAVKIHGAYVPVRAEVVGMDTLSAHADYSEILTWLGTFPRPPKTTFITHGEPAAADELRRRIQETLGWSCVIPDYRDSAVLR